MSPYAREIIEAMGEEEQVNLVNVTDSIVAAVVIAIGLVVAGYLWGSYHREPTKCAEQLEDGRRLYATVIDEGGVTGCRYIMPQAVRRG